MILGKGKELYLVMDEMNQRNNTLCYNLLKYRNIKYLKITNSHIVGSHVNGLVALAERVCFKNIVFMQICKEPIKSECKYVTLK